MISLIRRNIADALTFLRIVCAVLFVILVFKHQWGWALDAIVLGAYTDPLDGLVAGWLNLPAKRWFGLTGKAFNEIASGALSVLAPVALVAEFGLVHYRQDLCMLWVALGVFFGISTLRFNYAKSPEHQPDSYKRERAEVGQGWFAGFIFVCCGAQVLWLAYGWDWFVWVGYGLVAVGGILLSHHRWYDRPETREENTVVRHGGAGDSVSAEYVETPSHYGKPVED